MEAKIATPGETLTASHYWVANFNIGEKKHWVANFNIGEKKTLNWNRKIEKKILAIAIYDIA